MTARVALVAASAAAFIAGCLKFDRSCDSDADCRTGEFCSTKSHSCIVRGDAAPPEFTVSIAAAPPRPPPDGGTSYTDPEPGFASAYRRDEQVEVMVTSVADDVANVQARVAIGSALEVDLGAITPVAASECGDPSLGWCGKILVNLWE